MEQQRKVLKELIEKAVVRQHTDILEVLLTGYGNGDIELSPYLAIAAKNGSIKIAKLLVKHGAVVTNKIVQIAKDNGHTGTAHYLAKMKAMQKKKK